MTDNFYYTIASFNSVSGLLNYDSTINSYILNITSYLVPNPTNVLALYNKYINCQITQVATSLQGCINCATFACATCSENASTCYTCLPTLFVTSDGSFC